MNKENQDLRAKIQSVESLATQYLHSQPNDDEACGRHLLKALAKMADIVTDYRGMVEVEVYDIEWDTDGEEVDLPKTVRLMLDTIEDADNVIADKLSDKYEWCVKRCNFRMI